MVLLNNGPNDYRWLFVLAVHILSTVSLNSEKSSWHELFLSRICLKDVAVNSVFE